MNRTYILNIGLESNDNSGTINPAQCTREIRGRFARACRLAELQCHRIERSDTEDTLIATLSTSAPFDAVAAVISHAADSLHQSAIAALDIATGKGYLFGVSAGDWGGCDWSRACSESDFSTGFDESRFLKG